MSSVSAEPVPADWDLEIHWAKPPVARLAEVLDPQACRSGRANVINLDAIRAGLAERWPEKREEVWEQTIRFLAHRFDDTDVIVRIDETNALVVQQEQQGFTAQSRCIRATCDLVRFFNGEVAPGAVRIHGVVGLDGERLLCTAVKDNQIYTTLMHHAPQLWAPVRSSATPVLTRMGRNLSASVGLEPIWQTGGAPRVIGHYASRTVADNQTGAALDRRERDRLLPGDLADIDMAVLRQALTLRAESPALLGGLIVPVSYATLGNPSTRYDLFQFVQRLSPTERKSFGWEIVDMDSGIPEARLAELVAMTRQQCRGIICQLELTVAAAEKLKRASATLSVSPERDIGYSDHHLIRYRHSMPGILRSASAILFHAVPPDRFEALASAGARHCTLRPDAEGLQG